jgi:hypothetical protein
MGGCREWCGGAVSDGGGVGWGVESLNKRTTPITPAKKTAGTDTSRAATVKGKDANAEVGVGRRFSRRLASRSLRRWQRRKFGG